MSETLDYLKTNLAQVKAAVAAAEEQTGRLQETTLIAAVKYATDEELKGLLSLGVTHVGENRVQQLQAHLPLYESHPVTVHFIGHLQKNKVKYVVGAVDYIHSVDSVGLAAEIERHAAQKGLTVNVLVEINSGREPDKSGVLPEAALALCREVAAMPHLRLCGLMTMGPHCERSADYLPYFNATRELAVSVFAALQREDPPLLSMGMSESFDTAIAAGAHMVRVGRRLFAHEVLNA